MPKSAPTKNPPKDKRVAFEVPPEISADYDAIAKKLRTSKGGLGTITALFVIPRLKSGELVCHNGEIMTPDKIPASKAA